MAEFVRLSEVVNKKKDMRIVSVTVVPTIADCSGRIWFTDLQLQEGPGLAGYAPHTETYLQKFRENGEIKAPVWFNGVVRSEETVILFNLGKTSAPLDIHICRSWRNTRGVTAWTLIWRKGMITPQRRSQPLCSEIFTFPRLQLCPVPGQRQAVPGKRPFRCRESENRKDPLRQVAGG